MTPKAETLRTILQLMDAERTLGSMESAALRYVEKYSKDGTPLPEAIQESLVNARRLLAIGTDLSNHPEILDTLEITDQEKAGFKEAFRNRKVKPKQPDHCYHVLFQLPQNLGFARIYCLAPDPDCAVAIATGELCVREIPTEKLLSAKKIKWPPEPGTQYNHEMLTEVLVSGVVGVEVAEKV